MPTLNPRITITLQPSVHATLRRLSELTGNSQSAMVGELLEQSLPIFERMVKVLEAAHRLREQGLGAPSEIGVGLEHAQRRLERQLGLELDEFTDLTAPLLAEVEKVERRAGRAAGTGAASPAARSERRGARGTPPSNRGVRSPRKGGKQQVKGGRS